ncbi:amino acid adenylation domain-containing protein [Micromonospora sp. NPDC052213]|uniref:amino acid adenylation domain-containing protein n=1 Tax=Micromonospora sp. NPDC052213 TaxID=3155812 RepID=UPI0034467282
MTPMSSPRYLLDLVHRPSGADAERPAIVAPDGELSYAQLWERVGATAELLRRAGIRPGDLVGLYLHRSADYVTSLLATLTVGAVAVPVDPELPSGRAEQMLAIAAPRLVLYADRPATVAAPAGTGWRDVRTARVVAGTDLPDRAGWLPPGEQAALVLFTSGSTGQPKGVVLHHAGLVNRLAWGHDWFGFAADDRVLHKASIGFDASVHEIFSPLIAGGTVVIAGPGLQFDTLGLVRLIQREAVTTAHFVPTMLRHVLDEPELAGCVTLRRVLCGGEALDMQLVRRFRAALPCGLFNGYGPSETSINVSYWDCSEAYAGSIAPVGRIIGGVSARVLDEEFRPVADGETGELWIGGVAVGLGYLRDDERTAQLFRPDPAHPGARLYRTGDLVRVAPEGFLEFRGRVDDQVKIRGIRVEPGEVAAVLRKHPAVHDAVVVAAPDEDSGPRLVGYVVPQPRRAPTIGGLTRFRLPNGMAVTAASPDEAVFLYRQIFDHAEYSRFGVRLGDGAVVVDVGANIGLFSLWATRQARDVHLIAVEPNPDTLPYLRANLSLYAESASVVEAAVTDTAGTAKLISFPELSYLSGLGADRAEAASDLVRSHYRQGGGDADEAEQAALLADAHRRLTPVAHVVPTVTLSELLDRFGLDRVDLLKVNTEGAELSVLRGLRPEHWPRIGQVCLEVERSSVTAPQVRELLSAAGFEVHEIGDWNVGADADVSYIYAMRPQDQPQAASPWDEPADQLLTTGLLQGYLASVLPPAMHPDQLVFVDSLPRLPNGKVARLELPPPPRRHTEAAPEQGSALADRLREAWRVTLGVDAVQDDDNFLALGGHSLTALRVAHRVREMADLEVSPASCLRAGSFADWLARVTDARRDVRPPR